MLRRAPWKNANPPGKTGRALWAQRWHMLKTAGGSCKKMAPHFRARFFSVWTSARDNMVVFICGPISQRWTCVCGAGYLNGSPGPLRQLSFKCPRPCQGPATNTRRRTHQQNQTSALGQTGPARPFSIEGLSHRWGHLEPEPFFDVDKSHSQ